MRALRFAKYGSPDVLEVADVPEPVPAAGEAKVRVHAVGLNPLDYKVRSGALRLAPGFQGTPRGLGCDFAGEIAAIGGGPTQRHVGERVFGSLLPFARAGALADFIVVPYTRMLPLPAAVDAITAAALPIAGGTALQALADHAHVRAGQRVLITGAAGGVGHFAVQIAKHAGAFVVGVCSAANVDFVRALAADEVVDYAASDWTQRSDRFDVVLDAASASSFTSARRVLADDGIYLDTAGSAVSAMRTLTGAALALLTSRQRAIPIVLRNGPAMWARLLEALQGGTLRPRVEGLVPLEGVASAQREMETGHGRGKIVVTLVSA